MTKKRSCVTTQRDSGPVTGTSTDLGTLSGDQRDRYSGRQRDDAADPAVDRVVILVAILVAIVVAIAAVAVAVGSLLALLSPLRLSRPRAALHHVLALVVGLVFVTVVVALVLVGLALALIGRVFGALCLLLAAYLRSEPQYLLLDLVLGVATAYLRSEHQDLLLDLALAIAGLIVTTAVALVGWVCSALCLLALGFEGLPGQGAVVVERRAVERYLVVEPSGEL